MEYKEIYGVKSKEQHLGLDLADAHHLKAMHTPLVAHSQRKEVQTSNFTQTSYPYAKKCMAYGPTTILSTRS
jgi:hypothetical protein